MNKKNSVDLPAAEPNDVAENKLKSDWWICKREIVRWLAPMVSHSDAQVNKLPEKVSVIDILSLQWVCKNAHLELCICFAFIL